MKKLTVLFIDDDVFMLKALQRTARRAKPHWDFYLCEQAQAWQTALPKGVVPDAVFCDYLMPQKNGDQVLAEIATAIPSSVRVLLTGDTAEDVVTNVSKVTHFVLRKPFAADDVDHVFSCMERLDSLNFSLEIRNKLGRIGYFFALPEIATKLRALFAIEYVDIAQTAELIKQEAFIAAKIIQIANSAFLGYSTKTVSLVEAIKRLGLKLTETIVVSMAVDNCVASKIPVIMHKKISEWAFSYSSLCRQLSKAIGFNTAMQDMVSIAALLTGIGHLAITAETNQYINASAEDDYMLVLQEASILTVYILTLWGYPLALCKVILMQDIPDFNANILDENKLSLIMFVVKLKLSGELDQTQKNTLKTLILDSKIIDWIEENL
jgi:HD-like signal output (HDOD) protein/ActR/RegA family two-component response regulator